MKQTWKFCFLSIFFANFVWAQEINIPDFHFVNHSPAYPANQGPRVYFDKGHFNKHTAEGTYKPFADLLRGDGFRVESIASTFTPEALKSYRILVIVNAVAPANADESAFPHGSAFSQQELNSILHWIRAGGSLLLIADHAPYAGAASALALLLGVSMFDGYAGPNAELLTGNIVFGAVDEPLWRKFSSEMKVPFDQLQRFLGDPGQLGAHAILRGRSADERITSVVSFAGHVFYPSDRVEPLLIVGSRAKAMAPLWFNVPEAKDSDQSLFSVGGWLQGAAIRLGSGRAVVLGEATMCTALWVGPNHIAVGMNSSFANQNAQFCLNVVRWLDRLLDK